jgi:hypothetical protein
VIIETSAPHYYTVDLTSSQTNIHSFAGKDEQYLNIIPETQRSFFKPVACIFINIGNQSQPDRSGFGSIGGTSALYRVGYISSTPTALSTGLFRSNFMSHGDR